MKRHVLISILYLASFAGISQPLANDWIDYDEDRYYFKVKVAQTGLQRISYNTFNFALQSVGIDIVDVDPRSIQVFGRGTEQHIHVEGEADGVFNPTDFIEFYGQRNDGWADEALYPSADQHTNPFYSLYNDTAAYYISWYPNGNSSTFRYNTISFGTPASTPVSYVLRELAETFVNTYQPGPDLGGGKPLSTYIGGKGWMSGRFGYNNGQNASLPVITFNTPHAYAGSGAPDAQFELGLSGVNIGAGGSQAHHVRIEADAGGGYSTVNDLIYGSYDYVRSTQTISPNLGNTTKIRLSTSTSTSPLQTTSDYSALAFVSMLYPRTLAMDGEKTFHFFIPQSPIQLFFNATNFSTESVSHIYDLDQHKRYEIAQTGGNVKANIDPGNRRKMILSTSSAIRMIGTADLKPVESSGQFTDFADVQTEDAYLIITHETLLPQANQYKNYRSLDHNVVLVNIETLYDQFAYGIRKHPSAIRNFADYALTTWNSAPSHLFLLGKSIEEAQMRKSKAYMARSLVPCMGYPPSDISLTAGLNGLPEHVPAIPTGRLAARSNGEIATYLSKVREFENAQKLQVSPYTIQNRKWQKHILHFAGGDNAIENNRFKGYLGGYQSFAEDSAFAGKVFLFSKTSGNTIEQLNTDSLRQLLKEGAALMTFFGHASGNSFDLSVDDPSLWENRGRYPMVIANSCFSGNIHLPVDAIGSISEQYLFTPNEGAIAFIATPGLSYESYLNTYTSRLYSQFSLSRYGESLSDQMKGAAAQMGTDDRSKGVALEMTMHGDPALKLYPHANSELTINDPQLGADVTFKPANITTDIDSFEVHVTITNLGHGTHQEFSISATRFFPNETEPVIKSKVLSGLNYAEEVVFKFATNGQDGVGENFISIETDLPLSIISEFIETSNNQVLKAPFFVSSSDIFPVSPYNHAVIPSFDVTLKANTGFPFLPEATYLIEIDTTDQYNSPFKKQQSIAQSGAVIEWDPRLETTQFDDSTVFFWRVTPSSDTAKWREYSFQVIDQQIGWGQDHFFQYKNNTLDLLTLNRPSRTFDFSETSRSLRVEVLGNPNLSSQTETFATAYTLDGKSAPFGDYGLAPGGAPSMAIAVIDSTNLLPWGTYGIENGNFKNQDHQFGNSNNYDPSTSRGSRVEYWFSFNTGSSTQMDAMIDLINNEVEEGHYILAYTLNRGNFEIGAWQDQHFAAFEALGADSIRFVPNHNPYIFFAQKGHPNSATEVIGTEPKSFITLNTKIFSNVKLGKMDAPQIGPAMAWDTYFMKARSMETNSADSLKTTVFGESSDATISKIDSLSASGSADLSSVDASGIPYLHLNLYTEDNTTLTPSQLKSWHVLYDPAPDLAINPIKGQTPKENKTVIAGVNLSFGVAVENISMFDMGAFKVHYWLVDAEGETIDENWLSYTSLKTEEVLFDSVQFNTNGLGGRYFMYMEINPRDQEWHKEQYHFNNLAYRSFEIKADQKNPLLDVTFDGIHILNGDIVSPTPEIVMELKDENQFLLMDDTSSFDVFIRKPSGMEQRIPFISNGKEVMYFEPASSKQNRAKLTYKPSEQLPDGTYELKVMGRDASGNQSGNEAYNVEFEVINRSTVTHVMNYPNPFSTSTKFVFTLTGARIPDVFTIQIMTVTGKVVREITKSELGNIHIGRNISDYTWNGTDEYGDRLANGVYLYRVIMKIDGNQIEHRETSADNYFTKSFGKMYLFR